MGEVLAHAAPLRMTSLSGVETSLNEASNVKSA